MPVDLLDGMLQVEAAKLAVRDWKKLHPKVEQAFLQAQT